MADDLAIPLTPVYTTRKEVASILSTVGINLRIDDNDDGLVNTGLVGGTENEEQWLDDAIEEATDTINFVLLQFYDAETLACTRWVRRRASYLAAHYLAMRRGNPTLFCARVERIEDELRKIKNGDAYLPRAEQNQDTGPMMSNLVVDRNHCRQKLRVDQDTSVGQTDSDQDPDYYHGGFGFYR